MRLIDADALSVAVLDGNYWDNQDEDVIWQMVQDAPTIDAVPVVYGECKPGKEISRTMLGNETLAIEYDSFYCSSCGRRYKEYVLIYNYCPNCGVKWRKPKFGGDSNE